MKYPLDFTWILPFSDHLKKKNNARDEKFRDNVSAIFVDVFISTWHCKHIYDHIFYFVIYISPLISVGAFVSGKLYPWLIKVSYPNDDGLKIAFNIAMSCSRYGNFFFLAWNPTLYVAIFNPSNNSQSLLTCSTMSKIECVFSGSAGKVPHLVHIDVLHLKT